MPCAFSLAAKKSLDLSDINTFVNDHFTRPMSRNYFLALHDNDVWETATSRPPLLSDDGIRV